MGTSVVEVTNPYLSVYSRVPSTSVTDTCTICHVPRDPDRTRCWSCGKTSGGVTHAVELVVPVSLYQSYSQLGRWLRRYKDPGASVSPGLQRRFTALVAASFGRFLGEHAGCIRQSAGRSWDVITTVPSSRPSPHPFAAALGLLSGTGQTVKTRLRRTAAPIGRNQPNENGYEVIKDVAGRSVLVADDTWTTGSHLQSAASALSLAGADVVGAVVVGRVIRTEWSYTDDAWWSDLRQDPFTFDECCLE